ncbi:KLTH0E16874p [Lachancea thermotolerans CBS 6340]|uniref:KLTH0E16874p n=1 Tax=Lachancea thermotolerans (strain ATCC 56472 / CBS 6340 / NRRL Y-8284) TaxID=559295 RepID=C5DJ15_LACTC|nr:KLTH0E16874p [Lachancea thermotolerans CBS 6340]CAR23776.1 KLTH0E16874p [Lachancea thermotolerans CBS 6340]
MKNCLIDVNERNNKKLEDLAVPWRFKPLQKHCIKNTNLIDVVKGTTLPEAYIFVEDGKISRVEFGSGQPVDTDSNEYQIIDGTGKYVTPGLFDNHVHMASVTGELDIGKLMTMPKTVSLLRVRYTMEASLARGFTTVRDCGGAESYIKAAVNDGSVIGPRMITCGHAISQTGGHGDLRPGNLPASAFESCSCHYGQVGVVADGVGECYKAAREEFRRGADFIKIMAGGGVASPTDKITNVQFCHDEIRALVDVANTYHTYVTAHAYTAESIQNCIKLGVRGIEHGNLLDEETAELMAKLGCYLTPTLVTYKIMASDQFGSFLGPVNSQKNAEVLSQGIDALKIAQSKGVKICYGSDLLGPLAGYQTQEFFIRGKVQTAQEVLLSATVTPAEMNGLGDKLGQIKPGFIADLLLMNSNPLNDIAILDEPETNLVFVMKEGRIY